MCLSGYVSSEEFRIARIVSKLVAVINYETRCKAAKLDRVYLCDFMAGRESDVS